jgi:septum formation protein
MQSKNLPRIILASRSPARRILMKKLGVPFECHTSDYEEDMQAYKTPKALAKFLALQKAKFIAHKYPDSIIIGADTFCTHKGKKIGKPKTMAEAKKIIKGFSRSRVQVHTGLATIQTNNQGKIIKKLTSHTVTTLKFGPITDSNIKEIIKKDPVLKIAGAITIEGESGKYIEKIIGDYQNVIGLPLFRLREILKKF